MAFNDVRVISGAGPVLVYQTEANATDIVAGEPVKYKSDGSPYAIPLATGDPEIGTDQFLGVSAGSSSHTASADGTVDVITVVPGQTVLECKATTAANVDTKAELDALVGDAVAFDLTGAIYTVDEDEGNDDNVHGLILVGGDPFKQTMHFQVKASAMKVDSII